MLNSLEMLDAFGNGIGSTSGSLDVNVTSGGGGGGDATAANQLTQIANQGTMNTTLTAIDTDQSTAVLQTTGNDYILNGMTGIPNKNRSGKCYIATTEWIAPTPSGGFAKIFGLWNGGSTTMYVYNIQVLVSNFSTNDFYNVKIEVFSNATNPFGGGAAVTPVNLNRGSSNTSSVVGIKYNSGAFTNSATPTIIDASVMSLYGSRLRRDFLEDMIILPPDNGIELEMGLGTQHFVVTIRWYEE